MSRKYWKKGHSQGYTWDIESILKNRCLEKEFNYVSQKSQDFLKHRVFTKSPESLLEALKDLEILFRKVHNLYSYSSMNLDQDTRILFQSLFARASNLYVEVDSNIIFEPELLSLDEDTIRKYVEEKPELKLYEHYFENILRKKAHVLSARGRPS